MSSTYMPVETILKVYENELLIEENPKIQQPVPVSCSYVSIGTQCDWKVESSEMNSCSLMTNWSNELEVTFLETYQSEPILWDPKHPNHKDRNKVHEAWGRISEVLNIPVADLKRKKDSLMATFRMHRRKIKASEVTGSGTDDIYKPIWFAFDLMNSFLGEGSVCKTTRNAATDAQERNNIEVEQEYAEREIDPNSTNDDQVPVSTRAQIVPMIRQRKNPTEHVEAGHTINETLNTLNKVLFQQGNKHQKEEDECDLYGKILAKKLRKLPDHERLIFMHEVDGIFIHHLSANKPVWVVSPSSSPTAHHIRPGSASSSHSEPIPVNRQLQRPSSYYEPPNTTTAQQVHQEVVQCANLSFPSYSAHRTNTSSHSFMSSGSQLFEKRE